MALYVYDCPDGHVTERMMTMTMGEHTRTMKCQYMYGDCTDRGHPVDGTHQHTMSVCEETATRREV